MQKNKIAAWLGTITLAVSLVACGDKTVVSESSVIEEEVAEKEAAENVDNVEKNELYGKITAINANEITIALGEMPERPEGEAPERMPEKPEGEAPEGMPEKPEGEAPEGMPEKPEREAPEGMPEKPEGEAPGKMSEPSQGEIQNGTAPQAMPELTLTGEEKVVAISEETKLMINGEAAAIDDMNIGDMAVIIMDGEQVVSVEIRDMQTGQGNPPQGMPGEGTPGANGVPGGANDAPGEMPGAGNGAESSSIETKGVTEIAEEATLKDATYSSEEADVSAVVVADGGNVNLSAVEINKSGDVSNREASEFYGLNAAFLVKSGSSAIITDSTVTTDAEGANAIFATGEDAKIEVSNLTIETKGDSSRGLDATYGGTVIADTVNITTQGAHCAALATDRGEGTIEVTNGSFLTSGEGSPCIYSTGDIHVVDSEGTATGSAIAVVEGKNSIYVEGSTLAGYGIGRANGGIDDAGVMVYQSMSGDAGVGTGNFTAVNSSLSISEESDKYATSPMFFVTNTDAVIELTNTELNYGSGILLSASGNDGEWGRVGENGGHVEFNAKDQTLYGDVVTDAISSVALTLTNSTLEGCINSENKGDVTVILDSGSTWTVTGDSYVSVLTNEDKTCANIISNGYCIYYDADNSVNDWLNGESITLSDGGILMPAE